MRTLIVAVLGLSALLGGCASIIHGSTQDVGITSEPIGATVTTPAGATFRTPCKVKLDRNTDHVLSVSLDGYEPETVTLRSVLAGAVAGNILVGGIVGGAVDAATGAAWRLEPETVSIRLRPREAGQAGQ